MSVEFDHLRVTGELCYDVNSTENTNEFKLVQLYINNTNEEITVMHRNNMPVIVPAGTSFFGANSKFIIRNIYHFNSRSSIVATINTLQNFKRHITMDAKEVDMILNALLKAFNNNHHMNFHSLIIDKEIALKSIRNNSAVYVHEADLLLCDARSSLRCVHPYSEEGMISHQYKAFIEERKVSGIFIELIDNENTVKTRYMYVAKQLIEVPARKDSSKESGLYFTRANYDRLNEVSIEPKRYSFEEAEVEVGMYKTREEALSGGNPEILSKGEEERAKRELLELKRRMEKEKTESESLLLNTTHELELTKIKNKHLTEEIEVKKQTRGDFYEDRKLYRQDVYDERTTVRKDSSEFIKIAGVAFVTAIGVFTAMSRQKK